MTSSPRYRGAAAAASRATAQHLPSASTPDSENASLGASADQATEADRAAEAGWVAENGIVITRGLPLTRGPFSLARNACHGAGAGPPSRGSRREVSELQGSSASLGVARVSGVRAAPR